MISTNEEKGTQDHSSWEGEYITHLTDFKINDMELNLAKMSHSGRHFNSPQAVYIHKPHWCKQWNLLKKVK